ncbi:hypothetical protein IE53DRAFT_411743 [Violaceomyces palustris]|uniref:Uncharacterized protein n=1 Tax=Violaceomyces palustris TaxID=1673888 RepID=A0ACD0NTW7_9BASI|nr:hypothetical protein IE53DRAFT_411743 [Violaceomyces palustris]
MSKRYESKFDPSPTRSQDLLVDLGAVKCQPLKDVRVAGRQIDADPKHDPWALAQIQPISIQPSFRPSRGTCTLAGPGSSSRDKPWLVLANDGQGYRTEISDQGGLEPTRACTLESELDFKAESRGVGNHQRKSSEIEHDLGALQSNRSALTLGPDARSDQISDEARPDPDPSEASIAGSNRAGSSGSDLIQGLQQRVRSSAMILPFQGHHSPSPAAFVASFQRSPPTGPASHTEFHVATAPPTEAASDTSTLEQTTQARVEIRKLPPLGRLPLSVDSKAEVGMESGEEDFAVVGVKMVRPPSPIDLISDSEDDVVFVKGSPRKEPGLEAKTLAHGSAIDRSPSRREKRSKKRPRTSANADGIEPREQRQGDSKRPRTGNQSATYSESHLLPDPSLRRDRGRRFCAKGPEQPSLAVPGESLYSKGSRTQADPLDDPGSPLSDWDSSQASPSFSSSPLGSISLLRSILSDRSSSDTSSRRPYVVHGGPISSKSRSMSSETDQRSKKDLSRPILRKEKSSPATRVEVRIESPPIRGQRRPQSQGVRGGEDVGIESIHRQKKGLESDQEKQKTAEAMALKNLLERLEAMGGPVITLTNEVPGTELLPPPYCGVRWEPTDEIILGRGSPAWKTIPIAEQHKSPAINGRGFMKPEWLGGSKGSELYGYCGKASRMARAVGLDIFRTESKGWGLRCHRDLAPGEYICHFSGELLGKRFADERVRMAEARNEFTCYSFDFSNSDGGDQSLVGRESLVAEHLYGQPTTHWQGESRPGNRPCKLKSTKDDGDGDGDGDPSHEDSDVVIDSSFQGGPARFFNHSCNSNVEHFMLYQSLSDPIPKIVFFSKREIRAYEELTIDYKKDMHSVVESGEQQGNLVAYSHHPTSSVLPKSHASKPLLPPTPPVSLTSSSSSSSSNSSSSSSYDDPVKQRGPSHNKRPPMRRSKRFMDHECQCQEENCTGSYLASSRVPDYTVFYPLGQRNKG